MTSLSLTCAVMSAVLSTVLLTCWTEKVRFFATEHPAIRWYNTSYLKDVTLTARRYGRNDPQYYVGLNYELVDAFGNNVTLNFYFFELLTNVYKRSFVELHYPICDCLLKDCFIVSVFRNALQNRTCPFQRGIYNLTNMTLPSSLIPKNFPFLKGRIFLNVTITGTERLIGWGHIDMEIKVLRVKARPH